MLREFAYTAGGLILLAYVVDYLYVLRQDPKEPRRLRSRIPLIGHMVGLVQYGTTYYNFTSAQTDAEIYTVGIFNFKIYICRSPRLMAAIQKHAKTVSFRPFLQVAAREFGDANDETHRLLGTELVEDFTAVMRSGLAPGPHLDEQNLRMGSEMMELLDELLSQGEVGLLAWVKKAVVQASSYAVYGTGHPFQEPEVEEAFWKWQSYLGLHITGIKLLGGPGYTARAKVFDAYRKYIRAIPHNVSKVAADRFRVLRDGGITGDELAKQDATFPSAILANTTPTLFWTIWELFARPTVLDEVRAELAANAVTGSTASGFELDVAAVKKRCPVLLSVMQETQRMRHAHASIRMVLADTLVDDGRILLRKGAYLQMPGGPIHHSEAIWGASADVFDPYRFVPGNKESGASVPPSAFMAWGAPPHLCPARQFASTEILIAVAVMAMRADLQPIGTSWDKSPSLAHGEVTTLCPPTKDIKVKVIARDEYAGKWTLKMGESLTRISLASG